MGMVSVISGDPNCGKSTLVADIAARVSQGTEWPDTPNEANPAGGVVMLIGEDALAETLRPRIETAHGDLSKIRIIEGIRYADHVDPFNLESHLAILDDTLAEQADTRLLVIDPLDCFLGNVDSHSKVEVQRSLSGLATVAERRGVATIGVLHHRKATADRAIHKTLGSLGFVSAPRSVWCVTRNQEDRATRLLTCVKLNLCPDPTGLSFTIADRGGIGVVDWHATPVTMTADEAIEAEKPRSRPQRDDAADWLLSTLAPGAIGSAELKKLAAKEGYSWRTLVRAKDELGVRARQDATGWRWELPSDVQH